MLYVGVDVHVRRSCVCILSESGRRIKEFTVSGDVDALVESLGSLEGSLSVCYEASCGYGHLYDRLSGVADRVVVAHPGQLRLIFRSKRKNDRVDARKLAMLLLMDQVPAVHVPRVDVRGWRQLIEFRHRLVREQTRVKNGLRSLLRGMGVSLPHRAALWTRKGELWMASLALSTNLSMVQRDVLLESLRQVRDRLRRVERELKVLADGHPGVALLRTIPGVGIRTAEAVVAYIDDARRFRTSRQVGSYFGLVPCQDQSADRNRLGHITREGPSTVRKLLTEAAWQGIRRSGTIGAYFERVCGGDASRRKIALVATAHYLVRCMHAMLRNGEHWREREESKRAA